MDNPQLTQVPITRTGGQRCVSRRTLRRIRSKPVSGRISSSESSWVIYHPDYDGPAEALSLLRVDDNVLLFLDRNLKVLVGDASWSYTLNRTDMPARGV
jgi:hypothetical protein